MVVSTVGGGGANLGIRALRMLIAATSPWQSFSRLTDHSVAGLFDSNENQLVYYSLE